MPKRCIVPEDEILTPEQILLEKNNILSIGSAMNNYWSSVLWCVKRRLLANSMDCLLCAVPMDLRIRAERVDGRIWWCSECGTRRAIRDGSCFTNKKISLLQNLLLVYGWANGLTLKVISREAGCSVTTAEDRMIACRKVCERWVQKDQSDDVDHSAVHCRLSDYEFIWRKSIPDQDRFFEYFLIALSGLYDF